MISLFFNIVSRHTQISVLSENAVLCLYEGNQRMSDDMVISTVTDVLKNANKDFNDLNQIACVVGPGGFTSLRIAVSFANTLCDQLQISSSSVHLSDWMFALAEKSTEFWIHSTKKDFLFIKGGKWKSPTLVSLNDFQKYLSASVPSVWTGELIDEHAAIVSSAKWRESSLNTVKNILPDFVKKLSFCKEQLLPWYGRSG